MKNVTTAFILTIAYIFTATTLNAAPDTNTVDGMGAPKATIGLASR